MEGFGGNFALLLEFSKTQRRYLIIFSLIAPIIALASSRKVRQHWERIIPEITARRVSSRDKATTAELSTLSAAVRKHPENPTLLRALARGVYESDPAQARLCYDRIQRLHASTASDHAAHSRLLARLEDLAGAKAILSKIPDADKSLPDVQRAWLTLHLENRDFAAADQILANLEMLAPEDIQSFLNAAASAVKGNASSAIIATAEFRALAAVERGLKRRGLTDLNSIASQIISLRLENEKNRSYAAKLLRQFPDLTAEARLAAVRLEHPVELGNASHQQLCAAYQHELAEIGGLSALEKDRSARFLQQQSEHAMVTELISLQESYSERYLFERRIDSLLHLAEWRAAADIVASAKAPEVPRSRCLFEALKSLRSLPAGHPLAPNLLSSALDEAIEGRKPVACYAVGCMALEQNLKAAAIAAFSAAAEMANGDLSLVDGIISSSRRAGLGAREVLQTLEQHASPRDTGLQDRLCYLRLLAGQEPMASQAFIAARRAQMPDAPYLKLLEALQLHKSGDFIQSMQTLVPLPSHRWHQGEAAVLAAIMASAGKFEQSSVLFQQVQTARLFPEENAMIEPWRTRMALDKTLLGSVSPALAQP